MKKSTKIIATVIAVTLVITAMLVAIYAATAGNANISANVSWTAQAGVNLEFWAKATGGDESKEIAKTTITPTTTNTDANIIGDLSCNFTDTTDDGVNNPNAIKFTYYVRNKSLTPLNIRVTKTPAEAEESGTGAENHKPKVTLNSDTEGNNTLTAVSSTSGYDLKAGDIFTYSVTLSLAKGGTGTINADFGLAPNFDAGVTFNFNVGGDSNGTIVTSVDGASPTTVSSSTLAGQTLGEYLATQQTAEYSTGWFFDEGLTKVVSDDYLNDSLKDSSISSFYCKTASIDDLVFTLVDASDLSGASDFIDASLSGLSEVYLVSGASSSLPSGDVVIPNMYNGKPVVSFNIPEDKEPVDEPVDENDLPYIPAFKQNANITGITLPNSMLYIEYAAFDDCTGLASISIPNSVVDIFPAFYGCSSLTTIEIPSSIKFINDTAFQGCNGLKSIAIPKTVEYIGIGLFNGCDNLKSIEVDSKNPIYDSRDNCNAIIETSTNTLVCGSAISTIPNTVTTIGDSAFKWCTELTSITIPKSVKIIGDSAFLQCSELISIEISDSVTTIGNSAFWGCSGLTSIEIPNSVSTIGFTAFEGCFKVISVSLGNGLESIGECAFSACTTLASIELPSSVTNIGEGAFRECRELTSIVVANGNPKYDSRDNCNAIIETASNTLIAGCMNTIIPNTVTIIGDDAFYYCSGLTSITMPNSITSIGNYAFDGCSGLTSIGLSNSITHIGQLAFAGCSGLTSISIPDSVTEIHYRTFVNCTGLTKIFIPESVRFVFGQSFTDSPFYGCSSTLQIYCETSSKPTGWGTYWNYYGSSSSNQLNVTWGVTRAQFEAL